MLISTLFFTTFISLLPISAEAQSYCYSSADCTQSQYCTTDSGECLKNPSCAQNEICPTVCYGTCQQKSNTTYGLAAPLSLENVFISTDCPNGCPQLLWFTLIEGVSQKIHFGSSIPIKLDEYSLKERQFVPVFSAIKPLSTPEGTIDSFSVGLSAPNPLDHYPLTKYYQLSITYNLQLYVWLIKVRQESLGHSPVVQVSDVNPSSAVVNAFFDPVVEQITVKPVQIGTYFPDLQKNSLIATAAYNLSSRKIISGYPDGTFGPLKLVNRAEAAKFLINSRYEQITLKTGRSVFPDTMPNAWYEPYIIFASSNSIIDGYPDGTFKPSNTVNTVEFLKMLTLTFNLPLNLPTEYIDVDSTDWYAQYAGIAAYYHLFPKRPNYVLYPAMQLTREEVAIAINALLTALDAARN